MGLVEIIILLAGATVFTVSFFIPEKKGAANPENKKVAKEEIKAMVSEEMNGIKGHVEEVVDEAIGYAIEKTERSLERLTNEKIMAVNEYSDTVLQEIHKNHEEALFLYDMLNSKHANLKDTVSKVNKTVKEVEETTREAEAAVSNFQKLAPEVRAEKDRAEKADKPDKTKNVDKVENADKVKKAEAVVTKEAEQAAMDISFTQSEDGANRNSNDKILELHKQGKSKIAIAKELGLGVGEVKLVIDLYKNM